MVKNQSLEIRLGCLVHKTLLIEEEVVTDAAADVGMTDTWHSIHLAIKLKYLFVRPVHVRTGSWKETRFPSAFVAEIRIFSPHSVHVGGRGAKVGDIPGKAWHPGQFLNLCQNRSLRTGLYELALMRGDGAEITPSEAPPVRDDGILDHVVGRNPLPLVARMRQLGERQIPKRVHLLGRGR